jgi:arginine N-succinyltransferase
MSVSHDFGRFELRGALPADEDMLLELARHLNTVNLPYDRQHVRELLAHSQASFSGELAELGERRYVFLLWDRERQRAVGTSSLVAQLGRHDAPYIYFNVLEEEKYSRTLKKHFHHQLLQLGFSYRGPTELAGLVVDPEYRRHPLRLGLLVSFVRFVFIKAQRSLFRDRLLAELLPPLEPDGTSHLWEALGRRFTGLSYAEADRLSSRNKEFVRDLFPGSPIYACLLSREAEQVIGQVGASTRVVEAMLTRIGFRYAHRVDPFDGGPHFTAKTDEVLPVVATQAFDVAPQQLTDDARNFSDEAQDVHPALLVKLEAGAPFVRACATPIRLARVEGAGGATLLESTAASWRELHLQAGDTVHCLPLDTFASSPASSKLRRR